jgi:ADP-ribose pyrophosphatase
MWIYLGENLTKSVKNTDHDEFVELLPKDLNVAVQMVWNGEITDVKTIIGILWAERLLS